jgi:SAM-dependent methyltransferase
MGMPNALIDGYDVVACNRCGFCFADNLPSQDRFDAYYEQQSKYEDDTRPLTLSEWDLRSRPFSVSIISNWLPNSGAKILDVGCAAGALLGELKLQGYSNVQGLDPSPTCGRAAKSLFGIEVKTGTISKIPPDIGTFDLVIFGSVLEHILDLQGTIKAVQKLLNPGGCVYIEVPDMARCSLMNDAPYQEFSVEHINFFSPISLENLWARQGFETVGVKQTEIDQIPRLTLYEIKAMFRKTDRVTHNELKLDSVTRPELELYIRKSHGKLVHNEQTINALADSKEPILVWGVGTLTQSLLASTRLKEVNITAFVDSNTRYTGRFLNGIPIRPVQDVAFYEERILVASHQFQDEIVDLIKNQLKLRNAIITLFKKEDIQPKLLIIST